MTFLFMTIDPAIADRSEGEEAPAEGPTKEEASVEEPPVEDFSMEEPPVEEPPMEDFLISQRFRQKNLFFNLPAISSEKRFFMSQRFRQTSAFFGPKVAEIGPWMAGNGFLAKNDVEYTRNRRNLILLDSLRGHILFYRRPTLNPPNPMAPNRSFSVGGMGVTEAAYCSRGEHIRPPLQSHPF